MRIARRHAGVAVMDGKWRVLGLVLSWPRRCSIRLSPCHVFHGNECTLCGSLFPSPGYLYAVGGHNGSEYLKSAERYDPEKDEWSAVASMGCRRGGLAAAGLGGRLYAVGGYNGYKNVNTVERYDVNTDMWTMVAPMKLCRSGLAMAVTGQRLLAVGGHNGTKYLSATEWFDPRLGIWESGPELKCERAVAGVAILTGNDWAAAMSRLAAREDARTTESAGSEA